MSNNIYIHGFVRIRDWDCDLLIEDNDDLEIEDVYDINEELTKLKSGKIGRSDY